MQVIRNSTGMTVVLDGAGLACQCATLLHASCLARLSITLPTTWKFIPVPPPTPCAPLFSTHPYTNRNIGKLPNMNRAQTWLELRMQRRLCKGRGGSTQCGCIPDL